MAGKSLEQRLSDTETRIRQLEAQKRRLAHQVKIQERKDRTRQLIQIGGIMARLGIDTVDKAQALQLAVEQRPEVLALFRSIANSVSPAGPDDSGGTAQTRSRSLESTHR